MWIHEKTPSSYVKVLFVVILVVCTYQLQNLF